MLCSCALYYWLYCLHLHDRNFALTSDLNIVEIHQTSSTSATASVIITLTLTHCWWKWEELTTMCSFDVNSRTGQPFLKHCVYLSIYFLGGTWTNHSRKSDLSWRLPSAFYLCLALSDERGPAHQTSVPLEFALKCAVQFGSDFSIPQEQLGFAASQTPSHWVERDLKKLVLCIPCTT